MLFHSTQYAVPECAVALPEAGQPFLCLTTKRYRTRTSSISVFAHLEMDGPQCKVHSTAIPPAARRPTESTLRIPQVSPLSIIMLKTKDKKMADDRAISQTDSHTL